MRSLSLGGPCAGKTTFLASARQWLENRGLRVAVLGEGATDLITSGFSPFDSWKDPLDFQRFLLLHSLEREERFYQMLSAIETDRPRVLLCDRGVLDAQAYVTRGQFLQVIESLGLDYQKLRDRYRQVVHLVTAADGALDSYTLANNVARSESPELAIELDRKTQAAWLGHQHLHIINNSGETFQKKMERALAVLARTLNMPEPLEKERKFLVHEFSLSDLSLPMVSIEIEQTYLRSPVKGTERRVRKRSRDGSSTYYYTEKEPTGRLGERIERERQVTLREYESLLTEQDPVTSPIYKTRYTFTYVGRHFELDVYASPNPGLVVLEIEVEDMTEVIVFPPGFKVEEVTGDPRYTNAAIAKGPLQSVLFKS